MAAPKKNAKKVVTTEETGAPKSTIDALDEYIQLEKQAAIKNKSEIHIGKLTDFESTSRTMHRFTNVLAIDLNTHGWKKGDIIAVAGAESAGKSSITMSCIEGIQMHSPKDVFLIADAEGTISETFADRMPYLDRNYIRFTSGESMEKTFNRLISIAEKGLVDWIIIDSLDTLVSEAELDKELEDSVMFKRASVISRALAKINPLLKKNKIGLIIIQQLRSGMKGMFVTEDTSGGKAMRFYPSARIFLGVDKAKSIVEKDLRNDQEIPKVNAIKFKSQKNKLNRPQVTTYGYLNVFEGSETASNRILDVTEYATSTEIAEGVKLARGTNWITLTDPSTGEDIGKFNGKENFERGLSEDINLYSKIKMFIYGCNVDPAMFIVNFEQIKTMIIRENNLMKERKIKLAKRKEKEIPEFEELVLAENPEDFMPIEKFEEGQFKLMTPEKREEYIQTIDAETADKLQTALEKRLVDDKKNEEFENEDDKSLEEILEMPVVGKIIEEE